MANARWLLLTHQLPNEPSNLRVRVWRKLQALGAVPVKNSIYVLPNKSSTREDFEWLRREIVQSGGEAAVFAGDSVADSGDDEIIKMFREARSKDFAALSEVAQGLADDLKRALSGRYVKDRLLERYEKRWTALALDRDRLRKIDFFSAPNGRAAERAAAEAQKLFQRLKSLSGRKPPEAPAQVEPKALKGRVWVTRVSPHIDRLACAWLIRRFVDAKARFKFVTEPYKPQSGRELRFDMVDGEFTHFGDWCSFETIVHRLGLADSALSAVAEIVHDLDLKDRKFGRIEAPGVGRIAQGLARAHKDDLERVEAAMTVFDALYLSLQKAQ